MLPKLKTLACGTSCLVALTLAPHLAMAATIDTATEVLGSYTLFVAGNLGSSSTAYTTDSQGAVVVGGNAYLQNMDVATLSQANGYGLVVGGQLDLTSSTLHGNTYAGQSSSLSQFSALGNVTTAGNLTLNGGTASGNVTVGGSTQVNSASLKGNVSSSGNYTQTAGSVGGNVTVGTTGSTANLSLTNGVVKGNANVSGNATVASSTIKGSLTANGSVSTGTGGVGSIGQGPASVPTSGAAAASVAAPINISSTWSNLKAESAILAGLPQTAGATTTLSGHSLTLTAASNKTLDVFYISGSTLSTLSSFTLNAASGDTVIINVTGSSASLQNAGYTLSGGITGSHVLFNFHDATSLLFSSIAEDGSILAPNATISGSNGRLSGSIVAASLQGSLQLNNDAFTGSISAVPLPGALALFAPLLGGLSMAGRRRRKA